MKTWQRDIADQAKKNQDAIEDVKAALTKAMRVNQLVKITAPRDGVVLRVAEKGAGSVLREAEPLMVLLPARDRLKADINIKSADIGYIRAGDAVDVKVDAYPYQLHGVLHGTVRAIAAASINGAVAPDATSAGIAMHSVTVSLSNVALNDLPQGTGPIAGMTVSGDVHVGTRSVLAYFLMPITRGFSQSLREP
jgi:HlyD family secretion protein